MSQMPGPLTFCEDKLRSGDFSVCPCKFVECSLDILFQKHFPLHQKKINTVCMVYKVERKNWNQISF